MINKRFITFEGGEGSGKTTQIKILKKKLLKYGDVVTTREPGGSPNAEIIRDLLVKGLNKINGVFCPKPKGAFYAIAQLPIDDADKFSQWILEDFDLNGETVMLAPAAGFYATPGAGINQVRIAYVLNREALKSAIRILSEALKVYPGRTI